MNSKDKQVSVLVDAEAIRERVAALARQIEADYKQRDKALICVGVLKGSFLFFADLVRELNLSVETEFVAVSSYGDETVSSGIVRITLDLARSIQGRDVLIIEDIVDTGLTAQYLLANFQTRQPKSVKLCSLLEKPAKNVNQIPVDYCGFKIEDQFVVGYGLDYAQLYRNLPYIGILNQP